MELRDKRGIALLDREGLRADHLTSFTAISAHSMQQLYSEAALQTESMRRG